MAKKQDAKKAGKNGASKNGAAAAKSTEDMAAVMAEYNARLQREILPIPDIPRSA